MTPLEDIIRGESFKLFPDGEKSFSLYREYWNDFGFKTIYKLCMKDLKSDKSYTLATVRIMFKGQTTSQIATSTPVSNLVFFINSLEDAVRMLYLLTKQERAALEELFKFKYDSKGVEYENVFNTSLLRSTSLTKFNQEQEKIKEYVQCPIDFNAIIRENLDELEAYINILKSSTDKS